MTDDHDPTDPPELPPIRDGDLGYCPRCECHRVVHIDHDDVLCGTCGLVL